MRFGEFIQIEESNFACPVNGPLQTSPFKLSCQMDTAWAADDFRVIRDSEETPGKGEFHTTCVVLLVKEELL